ncbi:hypothetical protein N0V82_010261 [Gnomoniopsis sp. IMI 355080]|nr:hypothetical protein N0V82_010261 [Gnomoniopsis sp. IMI 355080]
MPSKGDVSGYTGVFRLASPSDHNRKVIKRNRQVVSCLPCRNRKLKCDRQQPCASCVRRHEESGCTFHAGAKGGGAGSNARDSGQVSPLPKREMQTKLAMLENLVQGFMSQSQPDEDTPSEVRSRATSRSAPSPAGGSFRSTAQEPAGGDHLSRDDNEVHFVGATNYQAVLECIRELQGCVQDAERPAVAAATSPRQQGRVRANDPSFAPETPITIQEIMKILPTRAECDSILTFYFQQTYMVPLCIHTGQFQRTYERFWLAPGTTSLLWISLLFSILSTSVFQQVSKTLGNDDESNTLAADTRSKIVVLSSMAYQCLLAGDYLLGKPYSVEATLIFGMHLVLQKRDTEPICWHMIGTAVRLAQQMGYHRDASYLVRNSNGSAISAFDAEMRRRVWASLEYFDVVYSFQHGVPPIIHGDMVDTQLPSNLRDEEFSEDISALPQVRSTLQFTPILGFVFGARQVKLLRRVIQLALSVKVPSYGDVRILDSELRSLHEDVPPSLRYRPVRESGFADVPVRRVLK